MPSLNVVDYIDECMESVLNQTLADVEIICVDAGSNDGTWEKLKHYKNQCPPKGISIILLHSEKRSYGHQVNLGIDSASGEYVAILETDDYVEQTMYEELYRMAIDHALDYVKADFDSFWTDGKGNIYCEKVKLWPQDFSQCAEYESVINPQENSYLHSKDQNIWKGIYRRDFLHSNNIRLNETPGAAFQDIGFTHQVLSNARKALYTEKSFYRYRTDRDDSSINSPKGLMYAYQEFDRLLEMMERNEQNINSEGLFNHMLQSFLTEYNKVLCSVGFNEKSEQIEPYRGWFVTQLQSALKTGTLRENYFNRTAMRDLDMILNSPDIFVCDLKKTWDKLQEQKRDVFEFSAGKRIYVFGAGRWGEKTLRLLIANERDIAGVCDNDSNKWGAKLLSETISSPAECYSGCLKQNGGFIVANKNHSKEIKQQLMDAGIDEASILVL